MFFIVQEIPIPRFNRRMEQRCKYNHLHTIICNKQVLFLLNQCNIYKCLFFVHKRQLYMIYLFHKRQNAYFAIRFSISVPVYLLLANPLSPFPYFVYTLRFSVITN